MNTFSSLLKFRKGKPPTEAQERARRDFSGRLAQSKLALRNPADPIAPTGKHIILGVATYAAGELKLLDQLEEALKRGGPQTDVAVFDVLDCQGPADFDRFIPGIDPVYRTPVIGVIADGKLVDQATGLSDVANSLRRFKVLDRG